MATWRTLSRPARRVRCTCLTGIDTAVLSLDPKSDAAFKTLLFLLLETDAYAAALELVESTIASQSRGNLEFEKAYCLYRLHKEEDSLKIVESAKGSASGDDKVKWEHLEAQIVS